MMKIMLFNEVYLKNEKIHSFVSFQKRTELCCISNIWIQLLWGVWKRCNAYVILYCTFILYIQYWYFQFAEFVFQYYSLTFFFQFVVYQLSFNANEFLLYRYFTESSWPYPCFRNYVKFAYSVGRISSILSNSMWTVVFVHVEIQITK